MPVFKDKMTLGGKLSLYLLVIASCFVMFDLYAGRGRMAEWVVMWLGFPLMYIPKLVERLHLFEKTDWEWVSKWFWLLMHILLWVGSCYLWGHVIAGGVWLVRPFIKNDDNDEPAESGGQ